MNPINQNQLNTKLWKLIIAILLVNVLGLCLRYFNLSTFIIFFGFRFHISFVLPFLIVFNSNFLPYIKKSFIKPECSKVFFFLSFIILPIIIVVGGLYFYGKLELGDPDYFYEFGISSIFDYPIYLLWNFPQIILLYFFLVSVGSLSKLKFLSITITIFLIFAFELVPLNNFVISYWNLGILILCSLIFSILINIYKNIYCFVLSLFTLLWLGFLAFGSNSATIIKILFASRYKYWDGFFEVAKEYAPYTLPIYFGIALIISLLGLIFFKKQEVVPKIPD